MQEEGDYVHWGASSEYQTARGCGRVIKWRGPHDFVHVVGACRANAVDNQELKQKCAVSHNCERSVCCEKIICIANFIEAFVIR